MAVTGMSFYYNSEKTKMLKEAAELDQRSLSKYVQIVLQDHIEGVNTPVAVPKAKKKVKKVKRVIRRRK